VFGARVPIPAPDVTPAQHKRNDVRIVDQGRAQRKKAASQSYSVFVVLVRHVTADETAELRRSVLRAGRPGELPGDDSPAFHLGVYEQELLVGTGNVRNEPAPWEPDQPAWRLRGMATREEYRGRGVGALVLDGLLAHCRAEGGGIVWCNARTPAQALYERAGFQVRGEPWVDPEIGPHVQMWLML
jgi:GNAT superfamily N-acetyltransferase